MIRQLFLNFLLVSVFIPAGFSQELFQQEVNYEIHVTLDDRRHELRAFQRVEYINNSSDTLWFLYFHLWPNAWSSNKTRLARQIMRSQWRQRLFEDPQLRGYIDSLDFMVDGRHVQWNTKPDLPDICRINLNEPVAPGDTICITTPFRVKIPDGRTSQLGHIGESYQIAHWYPKPAVYDKSGWHPMPWIEGAGTYSEFGSFDVSITLPDNYIVGATGNLQNEDEIRWLNKLAADTTWKTTYLYAGTRFPPSSEKMKTLRYKENLVNNFAWFADKRFNVMKGQVELPGSGREITTWVMFTNLQARLWIEATGYVNSAILFLSDRIGDYPYDSHTVVQSVLGAGTGAGYQGVSVIGFEDDAWSLNESIAYNIARSFFHIAPGPGERQSPFLDEGIARAYTTRYMEERYPERKLWEVYLNNRGLAEFLNIDDIPAQRIDEIRWLIKARQNLEQPLDMAVRDYSRVQDLHVNQFKTAMGFDYLRAYMGDSLFDSAIQTWYSNSVLRHSRPDDLCDIFETHTGSDLSWFFNDFTGTTKRLDYKVIRLRDQQLLVENNAELASPLIIAGMTGDSITFKKWEEGFHGRKWIDVPPGNYSEIKIDPGHLMPELYRLNNTIRTSGILPRFNPVKPRFLFNIDDPGQRTLVYLPLVNWTRENGVMPGIALHSGFPLPKPMEYFFTPFYSVKNSSLAGSGQVLFNIAPYDNLVRLATITLEGLQFGAPANQNYQRVKGGLDLHLSSGSIINSLRQRVYFRYIAASDLLEITLSEKAQMSSFMQFGYGLERKGLINPFSLLTSLETHEYFQKASVELNYRYSYYGENSGMDVRLFAGSMLKNVSGAPFHALSAGGRGGREKYLYGGTYPDRFSSFPDTFFSRQMTLSEGGLVSPVNDILGYSNWLISLSFTSTLPGMAGWMPVRPFATFLLNESGPEINHNSPFFYEAGLKAGIWDMFEIYFPFVVSENIGSTSGPFKDRIRFVLKLDTFDQLDFIGIMD